MNAARFIGPSLGGLVIALAGEGACFALNGLSYLAVLMALWSIRTSSEVRTQHSARLAMRQAFSYAFGHEQIRHLMYLVAAVSFFVTPYTALMPYFAREIYAGGARTLGFLLAAAGAGALFGTLWLASRKAVEGLNDFIRGSTLASGLALAAFSLFDTLWLAIPALVILGFSVIGVVASSNTLIQSVVKDDMRGRVMVIFTVAFLGIGPLGSLAAGWTSTLFGPRETLQACSAAVLATAIWVTRRSRSSRICR